MGKRIGSLVYRELYMIKKPLINSTISGIVMVLIGIMLVLSKEYGNLNLLLENNQEVAPLIDIYIDFFPIMAFSMIGVEAAMANQSYMDTRWKCYQLSLPISGYQFSFGKQILIVGMDVIGIILSLIYMYIIQHAYGKELGVEQVAFVILIHLLFLALAEEMIFFITLFGSQDKAGVAIVIMILIAGIALSIINSKFDLLSTDWKALLNINISEGTTDFYMIFKLVIGKLCPEIIAIYILIPIISWVADGLLFERRVK